MRVLIAEDDRNLRDVIARGLREQAYAVDAVGTGDEALERLLVHDYDLAVLDVLMPGRDGLDVCREVRRQDRSVPILLLTARDAVYDRITGLDAGADDYLTKPFAFGELLARLRALLRRSGEVMPDAIVVADLTLDTRRRTARRAGRTIPLTSKEYAFLEYLARNAGRVVTRAEITEHVWDENHDPGSNLIDVYVSRLRRKLGEGDQENLLSTRRGMGYMLAEPGPLDATVE